MAGVTGCLGVSELLDFGAVDGSVCVCEWVSEWVSKWVRVSEWVSEWEWVRLSSTLSEFLRVLVVWIGLILLSRVWSAFSVHQKKNKIED